jgi:hypothetical protein
MDPDAHRLLAWVLARCVISKIDLVLLIARANGLDMRQTAALGISYGAARIRLCAARKVFN